MDPVQAEDPDFVVEAVGHEHGLIGPEGGAVDAAELPRSARLRKGRGAMDTTGVSCHTGAVPVLVTRTMPPTVSVVIVRSPAGGASEAQPAATTARSATKGKANGSLPGGPRFMTSSLGDS